jgi:curved DNA-binding protein CbpA
MGAKDYYANLGVDRTESSHGIHQAYRQLSKKCHPDRVGRQGTQQFQEVQEAYEVLSDPGKRRAYDASIDRQRRVRMAADHTIEPLVPSPHPSEFCQPEPLVTRSVRATRNFAGPPGCTFCDGFGSARGVPCPFCGTANHLEDLEEFIVHYLRAFGFRSPGI